MLYYLLIYKVTKMIVYDLKEILNYIKFDLKFIKNYWQNSGNETEFERLTTISNQENFWQNPKQAEILKELQHLKIQREQYLDVINNYKELSELIDLFGQDEAELQKISTD